MNKIIVIGVIILFSLLGSTPSNGQKVDVKSLSGYWTAKSFSLGRNLENDLNVAQKVFLKLAIKYVSRNSYLILNENGSFSYSLSGELS